MIPRGRVSSCQLDLGIIRFTLRKSLLSSGDRRKTPKNESKRSKMA